MFMQALKQEMQGAGQVIVASARRAAPYLLRGARWEEASTLLEQMLHRDSSPATLAFALPLLQRIATATAGSDLGLWVTGVLAKTLWAAGRSAEAEQTMQTIIRQCVDQGNYRVASTAAGDLLNLLMDSGRPAEALAVADEMAGYTRQAGLGPWTQLSDETMRLQVLNAMGRYAEVLAAVGALRPKLDALPLEGEAEETVNPWNVRETLLDTGHTAALYSERWDAALALNAERVQAKQARGADALEVARTRFNDYFPLLRLCRYADVRGLLLGCRAVFEAERDFANLGKVYGALADLEEETGGRPAAVRFQEIALGYKYQAGQPEDCAISHHNLANYLERSGADPAAVLAHRLAAATIFLQAGSGHLRTVVDNLVKTGLPAAPPTFAAVAGRVEAIEGVRFRPLFERLPCTAADGDAAIAAVWRLVGEQKKKRDNRAYREEAMSP
jgi:tetratricopeptide (TPR) repeat protein